VLAAEAAQAQVPAVLAIMHRVLLEIPVVSVLGADLLEEPSPILEQQPSVGCEVSVGLPRAFDRAGPGTVRLHLMLEALGEVLRPWLGQYRGPGPLDQRCPI
jgi:hypothetical protein